MSSSEMICCDMSCTGVFGVMIRSTARTPARVRAAMSIVPARIQSRIRSPSGALVSSCIPSVRETCSLICL